MRISLILALIMGALAFQPMLGPAEILGRSPWHIGGWARLLPLLAAVIVLSELLQWRARLGLNMAASALYFGLLTALIKHEMLLWHTHWLDNLAVSSHVANPNAKFALFSAAIIFIAALYQFIRQHQGHKSA